MRRLTSTSKWVTQGMQGEQDAAARVHSMIRRRPNGSARRAQTSREPASPAVQPASVQLADRALTEKTSARSGSRGMGLVEIEIPGGAQAEGQGGVYPFATAYFDHMELSRRLLCRVVRRNV